eukprot:12031002-Prorocentrum_lima.AAC.1
MQRSHTFQGRCVVFAVSLLPVAAAIPAVLLLGGQPGAPPHRRRAAVQDALCVAWHPLWQCGRCRSRRRGK